MIRILILLFRVFFLFFFVFCFLNTIAVFTSVK